MNTTQRQRAKSYQALWAIGVLMEMGQTNAKPDTLLTYLQEPRVRALLDTIAYAEGTLKSHSDGYKVMFGGGSFNSFADHPRRKECIVRGGKKICTTAAGRYQIQKPTWDYFMHVRCINRNCGDTSFSPLNQDRVAVQAAIDCDALTLLFQDPIPFKDVFARLGRTWASMPGAQWGYEVYTVGQLQKVFVARLQRYV